MKSKKITLLPMAALMLFAAGCRSTESPEKKETPAAEQKTAVPGRFSAGIDAPARELAAKFIAGFAAALKAGDRDKLPEPMRAKVTETMFKRMCDSFARRRGILRETAFVTMLDQTVVRDYLWKFTFEKPLPAPAGSAADAAPAMQKNEVIYLVRLGVVDGKPVIIGCGFQE